MRKFLLLFSLLASIAIGSTLIPHEKESQATVGITAPDGYSIACISGFFRTVPHFCGLNTVPFSVNTLILDSTCRNVDFTSVTPLLPLSASAILINLSTTINSNNAIAQRQLSTSFYLDNTCTNAYTADTYGVREEVAVVAGTTLFNSHTHLLLPVITRKLFYMGVPTSGGTGSAYSVNVIGYYD